jgi:hypothetical protein
MSTACREPKLPELPRKVFTPVSNRDVLNTPRGLFGSVVLIVQPDSARDSSRTSVSV